MKHPLIVLSLGLLGSGLPVSPAIGQSHGRTVFAPAGRGMAATSRPVARDVILSACATVVEFLPARTLHLISTPATTVITTTKTESRKRLHQRFPRLQ